MIAVQHFTSTLSRSHMALTHIQRENWGLSPVGCVSIICLPCKKFGES
jgi:hypothetical protein